MRIIYVVFWVGFFRIYRTLFNLQTERKLNLKNKNIFSETLVKQIGKNIKKKGFSTLNCVEV